MVFPSALPNSIDAVTFMALSFMPIKSNETTFDPELLSFGVKVILAFVCAEAVTPVELVILLTDAAISRAFDPTFIVAVSVPT